MRKPHDLVDFSRMRLRDELAGVPCDSSLIELSEDQLLRAHADAYRLSGRQRLRARETT